MRILRKFLYFFLILVYSTASAAVNNVVEEDGSPSAFPWKLKVSNGTLTDNGDGTMSLAIASGTGDITSVGDCTIGACFDGTQGTILTFNNAGGDKTLDYDGTDFLFNAPLSVDASDPADSGAIRLDNAENIAWEATPAGVDVTLGVDASEVLQVSGALNAGGAITGSNLSGTNTGDQTITLTGDVTGTGTGSFAATVAANAVALGTDTTNNYVATIADSGNTTITVVGSGSETAAVTLNVVDVNCTDCLGTTEIADSYMLNTGDTSTGAVTINDNDAAASTLLTIGDATDADSVAIFGDLTVTGGDIILGTSSIFSGGDTASLNNIDALDATTESTVEAAIDTLSNLTSASALVTVGTITSGAWNAGAVTSSGKIIGNASLDVKNGATTSGVIAIFEDSDSGTNKATFEVPALAADTVYILPADDGDSGEQLQTNGSGTLTWESASTASGWTDNGATLSTTTDGDSVIIGGATAVGTSGTSVLMIENGTAPSSSPADAVQLYAKDAAGTVGSGAVLLSHFDGADAATSYTAEVGGAFTFVNNAQLDTAQTKFGASSLLLDGTNDSVTLADSTDWDLDAGSSTSYTLDLWVRFASTTTRIALMNQHQTDSLRWGLLIANGPTLNFRVNSTSSESDVISISTNIWYHIEIDMSGTTCYFFLDGTAKNNAASAATGDYSAVLTIGESADATIGQNDFNGHIDEPRIRRGTAEHTSGFTAPTIAYTATGAAELTVRDEDGNITTLSPHNTTGLPDARVEEIIKAGHIPTTFHHINDVGHEEWIDTVGVAMAVEKLTGQRMIFSKDKQTIDMWEIDSKDVIFRAKMIAAIKGNWGDDTILMDEKELERRSGWILEKARREVVFQTKRETEGKPLLEKEKPPLWLQDIVDILKAKNR